MKAKSFIFIAVFWPLFFGGVVRAQQERGQEDPAGMRASPSANTYMGGKEHYLPDSPNYMAGKRHYLNDDSASEKGKIGQGSESISVSKGETASGEEEKPDDRGGTQIKIEINIIPENSTENDGIIYLPVVRPKHQRGPGSPSPHGAPNPPQTGNLNPGAGGRFHPGTRFFR